MFKIIGIVIAIIFVIFIAFIILSLIVFNKDVNQRMKNRKVIKKVKIQSKTINLEDINNDIFLENKITMINIWGTYCGACIKELQDLQEIHDEFKERGVGVLGVIFDINTENQKEKVVKKAIKILDENRITYPNIMLDNEFKEEIKDKIFLIPTTIFVDKHGNVVTDIIEAACSKSEYIQMIEKVLNGVVETEDYTNKKITGPKCDINGVCDEEIF